MFEEKLALILAILVTLGVFSFGLSNFTFEYLISTKALELGYVQCKEESKILWKKECK